MIIRLPFLLITLLITCSGWGQTYSITGDVKDEAGVTIPYTNIILLKTLDSTLVSGTTTDDDGKFVLDHVEPDTYILKFSFIGYKDEFKNVNVTENLTLPTVVLKESVESLSEVELVYKKPTLDRQADRLVFNVSNTALSEGNIMEVLRSTPGVLVLDNRITVKNTAPTIFINNRKVHLSTAEVAELLQGTSASTIKSVEVITNPSARFDAESGVVLNIVMDKNLVTGYRGSVFGNYTQGVFPKMNYGMTNYFKGSKINVFVNYSYNSRKDDRVENQKVNYLDPNGQLDESWKSLQDRNTWSETHNISTNIDYNFDENNILSFSTNLLFLPYYKYSLRNNTDITDDQGNPDSNFFANSLARDIKKNLGFDLTYLHSFNNSSELSFNTHYTTYDYNRKQDVNSDYFDANDNFVESTAFNTKANQETQIFTSQLDYTLPIGDSGSFQAGLKGSHVESESGIVLRDIVNGIEIIDPNNTDIFQYQEDIYAGYLNFDKTWVKWSFSAGLRVEQTDIEGFSVSNDKTNTQDYLEWFPTASLSHNVSETVTMYANYKRSITRPDYNDLNPFKFFLNDNTIIVGNPNLKPVFTDHAVIGTSLNDSFIFEAYYKIYEDNIFEFPIQDNINNTITHTQINIDQSTEFGFDFLTYFSVSDSWFMTVLTSFYNIKDEGNFNGQTIEQDQWSNYSEWSNDFSFLKDNSLSVNFSLVFSSRNLQGFQLSDKNQLFSDLALSKTLFKGKGVLSLAVSDLFNEQNYVIKTKVLNQDSRIISDLDTRYIRVGFRYKFGNTKLSTNEKALSKAERDRLKESY